MQLRKLVLYVILYEETSYILDPRNIDRLDSS